MDSTNVEVLNTRSMVSKSNVGAQTHTTSASIAAASNASPWSCLSPSEYAARPTEAVAARCAIGQTKSLGGSTVPTMLTMAVTKRPS